MLARYTVRRDEFAASAALACDLVDNHGGPLQCITTVPAGGDRSGVGIVEGWRGTIVHRVEINAEHITRAKIVDPSWFNWPALPVAMADTIVPDFPLTNKSFNLSYAGNDLMTRHSSDIPTGDASRRGGAGVPAGQVLPDLHEPTLVTAIAHHVSQTITDRH